MKIVGTIYDYSEAQEFENIIKVYFIEERISRLYSYYKNKYYKEFISDKTKAHKSVKDKLINISYIKSNDIKLQLFSMRGLM